MSSEPGFTAGTWIILENSLGCELDQIFVPINEDLHAELFAWLKDTLIEQGDVIRFVAGESEVIEPEEEDIDFEL